MLGENKVDRSIAKLRKVKKEKVQIINNWNEPKLLYPTAFRRVKKNKQPHLSDHTHSQEQWPWFQTGPGNEDFLEEENPSHRGCLQHFLLDLHISICFYYDFLNKYTFIKIDNNIKWYSISKRCTFFYTFYKWFELVLGSLTVVMSCILFVPAVITSCTPESSTKSGKLQ